MQPSMLMEMAVFVILTFPAESKLKAWGESLTMEAQNVLWVDKLLIRKVANQSYIKAVQIQKDLRLPIKVFSLSYLCRSWSSNATCTGDFTNYMSLHF